MGNGPKRRPEETARLKTTAVRMIQKGEKNALIRERTGLDWKVIKRLRDTYEKVEGEYK